MLNRFRTIWLILIGKPAAIVSGVHFNTFDQMFAVYKSLDEVGVRAANFNNYTRNFTVSPKDYRGKKDADLRLKLYKHLVK